MEASSNTDINAELKIDALRMCGILADAELGMLGTWSLHRSS